MKSRSSCADVVSVMEQRTPQTHAERDPKPAPTRGTDHLAVSAEELMELIRAGQGDDLNELVRRTLLDRLAA